MAEESMHGPIELREDEQFENFDEMEDEDLNKQYADDDEEGESS